MRSINLDSRRIDNWRSRLFGGRLSVQVIVGAVAIAAIALALIFRPGQSSEATKPSTPAPAPAAAVKATATAPAPAVAKPTAIVIPTATVLPSPTPPKERIHEVASGDTLMGIATKYYNDPTKWEKIREANKDALPNPNILQVGQKLKIPE